MLRFICCHIKLVPKTIQSVGKICLPHGETLQVHCDQIAKIATPSATATATEQLPPFGLLATGLLFADLLVAVSWHTLVTFCTIAAQGR